MNHTPGPWSVEADCQSGLDFWLITIPILPSQPVSAGILASIKRYGVHSEQAGANADLLASAPTLAQENLELKAEVLRLRLACESALGMLVEGPDVLEPGQASRETKAILSDALNHRATRPQETYDR